MKTEWKERLTGHVDASSLATFRILFGFLMCKESIEKFDSVLYRYGPERFLFAFSPFSFLKAVPATWAEPLWIVMTVAALGVMLGFFFRTSTLIFGVLYSYFFLIEKSYYNNHFYLIILLTFLLLCTRAACMWSLDSLLFKQRRGTSVPFWQIAIIQWQLCIVYIYGAISKINWDWLQGEPMAKFLRGAKELPLLEHVYSEAIVVYFFSYGGLFFDFLVGPLLLYSRTRIYAFVALVFFHFTNSHLFSIGVFPALGIASAIVFFSPDLPRRVFLALRNVPQRTDKPIGQEAPARALQWLLVLYFACQLLLPFRHHAIPGDVRWTEEGHNFSWRMKLRAKYGEFVMRVRDAASGEIYNVVPRKYLTQRQIRKMSTRPHMLWQFARFIAQEFRELHGIESLAVHVIAVASVNGRPYQAFIDPTVDLATEPDPFFSSADWILPLPAGLPIGKYGVGKEKAMARQIERFEEAFRRR